MEAKFEKLKAFCKENGFDYDYHKSGMAIISEKSDPWDGVEFVTDGIKVYKVHEISNNWVYYGSNIDGRKERAGKSFLKPSTESAYVEQRKAEAFQKFGQIKWGDKFDLTPISNSYEKSWPTQDKRLGFEYDKAIDKLKFMGVCIYESGKWVERVKERITVKSTYIFKEPEGFSFKFSLSNNKNVGFVEASFLAKQLEAYLNNEIE